MNQNAELMEQNERLEHLIIELQCENDTIGDYITIYQHQRKIINEKIRARDEMIAHLSYEKEKTQERLAQLQESIVELLSKKGILKSHTDNIAPITSSPNNQADERDARSRSFSHNNVNGASTDEEIAVDESKPIVPIPLKIDSVTSCSSDVTSEQDKSVSLGNGREAVSSNGGIDDDMDDFSLQTVLHLMSELQEHDNKSSLFPPFGPKVHCRDCRGSLITL
ncbi:hypothetical protein AB6A40_005209 [Gnathostoma spinigerum]|uniref:Golgin subfamily A conserved domain-containing protein n=1 Tax=Gnathostoma spinigerum TaxID=75299 RepID=A0ABD6EES0_9BILA